MRRSQLVEVDRILAVSGERMCYSLERVEFDAPKRAALSRLTFIPKIPGH
jgi:hypothetical protein